MEMDYSLFDGGPGDGASEAAVSSVASVEDAEVPEEVVEPAASVEEAIAETPQQPVDDFDDSTPLTPREKILMERLERITGENLSLTATKPTSEVIPANLDVVARNFMDGLDLDETLATSENLNKLLVTVYTTAMQEASKLAAEQILQNLPSVISTYVTQHITMNKAVEDFYGRNPDLQGVKQTVATIANKIAAEHPEFTTEQVFDASAVETRKLLGIKETPIVAPKPATPAFVPTKNGRVREKAPTLSGIEKDVLDLIT